MEEGKREGILIENAVTNTKLNHSRERMVRSQKHEQSFHTQHCPYGKLESDFNGTSTYRPPQKRS
jgi:hypothetical protein